MCGICGIYNFRSGAPVEAGVIEAMKTALAHRGPDGHGSFVSGPVGFGHRRLSIIDLSDAGRQPMANEDETIWLTCNGEIYNYRALRQELLDQGHHFRSGSDTEVLVHLFEEFGPAFLERVEGMFALALWDASKNELFLARDRLGIKPLYYQFDGNGLAFGSEIKALLARANARCQLDQQALFLYTLHAQIPGPRTVFANVHKLPPANLLRISNGRHSLHRYWELPKGLQSRQPFHSEDEVSERLTQELQRVCTSHLASDVPVGAFLSGGLDSSTIVGFAAREASEPIRTFCVSFKDHPNEDESAAARLVANASGTVHTEHDMQHDFVQNMDRIIELCDEPFAITSAFALYGMSRVASSEVKVALSGDGADELFAGYHRHFLPVRRPLGGRFGSSVAATASRLSRALTRAGVFGSDLNPASLKILRRFYVPFLSRSRYYQNLLFINDLFVARQLFQPDFYREHIFRAEHQVIDSFVSTLEEGPRDDEVNRRLYAEMNTTLVDEMLTKVDRMSMGWGLEVRVPFLDHRLVEFAMSIPGSMKHDGVAGKKVLKKAISDVLPGEILNRPKHGFNVPLARWFRGELGSYLEEGLSQTKIRTSGIFNARVVGDALRRHRNGDQDNSTLLIIVLNWLLWYEHTTRTFPGAIEGWSRA